jgi:hypothetical protein
LSGFDPTGRFNPIARLPPIRISSEIAARHQNPGEQKGQPEQRKAAAGKGIGWFGFTFDHRLREIFFIGACGTCKVTSRAKPTFTQVKENALRGEWQRYPSNFGFNAG